MTPSTYRSVPDKPLFNYPIQSATGLDYSLENEIELRQRSGPTSMFVVIYLKLLKADERKKK